MNKTNEGRLTAEGQIVIPDKPRRDLALQSNDQIRFVVDGDTVTVRPAVSAFLAGYRSVPPLAPPRTARAVREEFERGVAEEVIASMARER